MARTRDETTMNRGAIEGKNGAIGLLEEATHLLRTSPAATLATYYIGAIPFVLGWLYFCADMSQSPDAAAYLGEASLVTAALFVWMKFCQALFTGRLRAQLAADEIPQHTLRQYLNIFFMQAVLQPSGLFLIPLALVLTVPFGWTYAFYQNVTALGTDDSGEIRKLVKRAWKQASLQPGQNHIVLGIVSLFGFFILLNWGLVTFSIPGLLKTLFGIESVFTQSPISMMNTTFAAAIFGMTYLTIDPFIKTAYVLRCFYGDSVQSGEDLRADLKRFAAPLKHLATLALVGIVLLSGSMSSAAQAKPEVSASELDRQIDKEIHARRYAWRMPYEAAKTEEHAGIITRFLDQIAAMTRDAVKSILRWIFDVIRGIVDSASGINRNSAGFSWSASSLLLYVLLAAVFSALAVFLVRAWRQKNGTQTIVTAAAIQGLPDLNDENVAADALHEDGWMKLAREFAERGELRLAMRALYLATLSHLALRNLINIARSKSNKDYENELQRRSHSIPELLPVFAENLSVFERIWYGMHEANQELVRQFELNVEKIRGAV